MTADAPLVTRKLALIAADMTSVEQLLDRGREAYLSDRVAQAAAERHIQRVIGRMIDVNYHLVTAAGHMPPKDAAVVDVPRYVAAVQAYMVRQAG